MRRIHLLPLVSLSLLAVGATQAPPRSLQTTPSPLTQTIQLAQKAVPEQIFTATNNLTIKVKEVTPYSQETDLQIICFFKHKASGDTVLSSVAEMDRKLGGLIGTLRNSGEFVGDELETLLFLPPKGTIKPKAVLLMGLGDERTLSLEKMHRIGTIALREAVKLKATHVSYASALRDQGNATLDTGDVASAVIQNVILAYNTERQLQTKGLSQPFTISEWVMEAGPDYYQDTVAKVKQGVALAKTQVAARKLALPIVGKSIIGK